MAIDDSPPRNRLIFAYTIATGIALVSLKFILTSYFNFMAEDMRARQQATVDRHGSQLAVLRQHERTVLEDGPLPLTKAFEILGARGRNATESIVPQPAAPETRVEGWNGFALIEGAHPAAPAAAAAPAAHEASAAPAPTEGGTAVAPAPTPSAAAAGTEGAPPHDLAAGQNTPGHAAPEHAAPSGAAP